MKHRFPVLVAALLGAAVPFALPQQPLKLPPGGALGHAENGAASLVGYLVRDRPCLPVKRFTADAGYVSNVSPSRRSFGVIVGKKTSLVIEGKNANVDGKTWPLSVPAFERDGDFFVPLEFFEKAFPARFTYDAKKRSVLAELPRRTLTIPIKSLPSTPAAPKTK
jgi:hypothetical protein